MAAPRGNQNARKAKDWEGALRRALSQYENAEKQIRPGEALKKIAETVVKSAVEGDWDAIEEIALRLDGKPTEHILADVTHRQSSELSDAELVDIATGSSSGAVETPDSAPDATELH